MARIAQLIMIFFVVCGLSACHEKHLNPNHNLTLEDFYEVGGPGMRVEISKVNEQLGRMIIADNDSAEADYYARAHYRAGGRMLWITRMGVSHQADTLLEYIKRVGEIGFSPSKFRAKEIEDDLRRMRRMDFSDSTDINAVVARLDYNLTKAWLRYYAGQRYGFTNPRNIFNKREKERDDNNRLRFKTLFSVKMETIGKSGYSRLLDIIGTDSVSILLNTCETTDSLYHRMKAMLPKATEEEKPRLLANMERRRWRELDSPKRHSKYVFVNIPAFELAAVDGDSLLNMKIVCGARATKTPLFNSQIMRMDLNPKWMAPVSIIRNEMSLHAGDRDYFVRNNYYITDKETGERMELDSVSAEMFRSGRYRVTQEGGAGNSLGRIIFRLPNDHAIYLHDTPTRSTFLRKNRSASHGCVRIEKPFEFARFLLKEKDEKLIEKIDYSMKIKTKSLYAGEEEAAEDYDIDKKKLLRTLPVEPGVPTFITYYTLYPNPSGELIAYDDVYGYDNLLMGKLADFIR